MTRIETTTIVDGEPVKQEHELDSTKSGFTVIVHQQGIKVDVPEFVEIDARDTIRCMDEMSQPAWEHISTGPLFRMLWSEAFDPEDRTEPPHKIEVLNMGDMGLRHVAGLIVLGLETYMAGQNIFVRNPETYLHPKTQRYIMSMFRKMQGQFGEPGKVVEVKEFTKKNGTVVKAHRRVQKVTPPPVEASEAKLACLKWLKLLQDRYGPGKEIVDTQTDDGRLTVEQLAEAVTEGNPRGLWFVDEFIKMQDG